MYDLASQFLPLWKTKEEDRPLPRWPIWDDGFYSASEQHYRELLRPIQRLGCDRQDALWNRFRSLKDPEEITSCFEGLGLEESDYSG